MAGERWVFTTEQLENTPSRKSGIDSDKETYYRQQAANFIQDMGQRLQVTQLCINTAIVYMHRFYIFHSFTKFHRNSMAEACLFLAAKVEEQPRKLEHVIKVAHAILHRDQGPLDTKSVAYLEHAQELVLNENILLQTLGFELQVDHPHKHIVETCNLIRAAKDLAQTSYFLATNSLHLTQMSLQYKPTFVASICIHLACKWAQFEIPRSSEGKEWFSYVDNSMTAEILEELTQKFLSILDKCPTKFKKKLMSKTAKDDDIPGTSGLPSDKKGRHDGMSSLEAIMNNHESKASPIVNTEPKTDHKAQAAEHKASPAVQNVKQEAQPKPSPSEGPMRRVKTESYLTSLSTKEYFERKDRERTERERIERERQKLLVEKEREEKAAAKAAKEAAKEASREAASEKAKVHQGSRHHTNIFEEMASGTVKPETEVKEHAPEKPKPEKPKDKHSMERSNVQHNYKDKFHEKDGTAQQSSAQPPRKLPFSVDYNKLPPEYQRKSTSHRHDSHREAGRHGYDSKHESKHKSHGHSEHRSVDHRTHGAGPSEHRAERSHGAPRDQTRHDKKASETVTQAEPQVNSKPEAAPPKVPIDPEEGEIIDDDSPSVTIKKSTSTAHGHRHHHRERRSSGHHHHSPAAATTTAPPTDRRKSPRNGRKEDPTQHHKKHEEPVPSIPPAPAPIDVDKLLEDIRRPTPEPGEIVEHAHKHGHHKSSHKSHKKDKRKDRDDAAIGSLKVKIDLKGMGKSSSPAEDKKKEVKLKIKPYPGETTGSHSREGGSGAKVKDISKLATAAESHKVRESPSSLKVKLKLPSTTGNGETVPEASKSSESRPGSSSSSIKLVLSKDSLGQYTPTPTTGSTASSHRSHKHSSSSASRKRPYSPSDAGSQLKHKLARNDSSSSLSGRGGPDLASVNSLTGSPLTGTPSKEALVQSMSILSQVIQQKQGELYHRTPTNTSSSKKHKHSTPPSDNPDIL